VEKLKSSLKTKLKNAKKIAVLGIGSELRGDDAAGMLVAEKLQKTNNTSSALKVFFGSTAPENLTGAIKDYKPTHILIIDSADTGNTAGTAIIIEPEKLNGISFCTHRLPTNIMTNYLEQSLNCKTIIIGIQPKNMEFCGKISPELKKSVNSLVKIIKEVTCF
jgi:hydrogenase 3 maturation protease